MHIKRQLTFAQKKDMTMADYFSRVKSLADQLPQLAALSLMMM